MDQEQTLSCYYHKYTTRTLSIGIAIIIVVGLICFLLIKTLYGCFNRSNQSRRGQHECQDCHHHREDKLAAIPVFTYGDVARGLPSNSTTTFANKACAICLDDYVETDAVRILPRCLHMFHKECIDKWLRVKSLHCPICRHQTIEESFEASSGNGAGVGNALPMPGLFQSCKNVKIKHKKLEINVRVM